MLADLVRGAGGKGYAASAGGRKGKASSKEKVGLDLDEVCGGKVDMNKDVSKWYHSSQYENNRGKLIQEFPR